MADSNAEPDDHNSPQSPSDSVQPQMTMHPISYSSMPLHMYPFPPGMVPSQPPRTKRRQVKNACTNCQKACKKCDDARPCLRCVKYGISEECVDSQRKERQKGIKRGPYKKRDGKTTSVEQQQLDAPAQQQPLIPPAVAATSVTPPMPPYMAPVSYGPPGFYGQYPPAAPAKPGEAPLYYPTQFYLTPMPAHAGPPPPHASPHEGESNGYPPQAQFYQTFVAAPYAQPYPPQYVMQHPPRPDMQMPVTNGQHHYAPYPQAYPKPPSRGPGVEMMPMQMDPRREGRIDGVRMGEGMAGSHGKSA